MPGEGKASWIAPVVASSIASAASGVASGLLAPEQKEGRGGAVPTPSPGQIGSTRTAPPQLGAAANLPAPNRTSLAQELLRRGGGYR